MRPLPLTIAMRDAWALARSAVDANLLIEAQAHAARAVELSGWDRYRLMRVSGGVQYRACVELPRGWVFYADSGRWHELVLVHPDAKHFVLDTVGTTPFVVEARRRGHGLLPMSPLLAAALWSALEAPADARDLSA